MIKKNNLYFKVLELLKEKNLTQTELAKKAGITQPSLSRVLAGKYNIKISNLEKIAKVLNVSVSYLLEENNNSEKNKDRNDELYEKDIKILKLEKEVLELKLKLKKYEKK